jgi:hypothetical protein
VTPGTGRTLPSERRLIVAASAVAGILLLVIAIVYLAEPARSLPSFFPGHEPGSSHRHTKHGIAALLLSVAAFLLAWFRSAPPSGREAGA